MKYINLSIHYTLHQSLILESIDLLILYVAKKAYCQRLKSEGEKLQRLLTKAKLLKRASVSVSIAYFCP